MSGKVQRYSRTKYRAVLVVTTPVAERTFVSAWAEYKSDLDRRGDVYGLGDRAKAWLGDLHKLLGYAVEGTGRVTIETETETTIELTSVTARTDRLYRFPTISGRQFIQAVAE